MFQENTDGGGLQIFRKVCLININRIRKHISSTLLDVGHFILPEQFPTSLITETLSHQLLLFQNCFRIVDRIFGGQKFQMKKNSSNLFWRFWPQIAKLNSAKIIEISSIAKICFAKFNFSSDIFVYLAVTIEQLYNKD